MAKPAISLGLSVLATGALLLSACATTPPRTAVEVPKRPGVVPVPESGAGSPTEFIPIGPPPGPESEKKPGTVSEMHRGTGNFLNTQAASKPKTARAATGEFTLNFEATDLQEVVKAILGDLLKENYSLDPKVTGSVTLQTSRPLRREELLPTLENLLRLNGAALLRAGGMYRILPQAAASKGGTTPTLQRTAAGPGYGTRVVPLRFVGAKELHKLLQPFLPTDSPQIVDESRNLLILSGTEQELDNLVDMVGIFDVDWLAGMSLGLFKLQNAQAKTLAGEIDKIFGEKDSPLAGLIRVVPIERLNGLLVISQRPNYLEQARTWIERLDQGTDAIEPRLFVYRVQNGKAKDLATILAGIFGGEVKTSEGGAPPPSLAPGEEPVRLGSEGPGSRYVQPLGNLANQVRDTTGSERSGSQYSQPPSLGGTRTGRQRGEAGAPTVVQTKTMRIIADDSNNSLVILAPPKDYKMIEAALRNLDVVPLQVLIEASVVAITLDDELKYGLEWTLKNNLPDERSGVAALDLLGAAGPSIFPAAGFSYAVFNAGHQVRLVLNALANQSKLNVLSSPSLMVLDNQTATIKVVTQVPFTTTQQQSVVTNTANILNSVQLIDAGVSLEVTPRVNAGGRITLELQQDVTDVISPTTPGGNPSFLKRNIQSTVTVQSGETIVLGGLIRDSKTKINNGVPVLKDLPLVGKLFGYWEDRDLRDELIVLLTPKAVRSQTEARAVTDEYRLRLKELRAAPPGAYGKSP